MHRSDMNPVKYQNSWEDFGWNGSYQCSLFPMCISAIYFAHMPPIADFASKKKKVTSGV